MSSTTNLNTLKINYLTQEQYEDATENEEINENELYFTPGHNDNMLVPVELTQVQYEALTPEEKNNGKIYCVTNESGTYLTASEVSYGSSSVQDALDTLNVEITSAVSVAIPYTSWYTSGTSVLADITVTGVTTTNDVVITASGTDKENCAKYGITVNEQLSGSLRFGAKTLPSENITVRVLVIN